MSARREEQAFNDGRLAFREGKDIGNCPRQSPTQRAKWREGFEHERRLQVAEKITPKQREESARLVRQLKDWALTL